MRNVLQQNCMFSHIFNKFLAAYSYCDNFYCSRLLCRRRLRNRFFFFFRVDVAFFLGREFVLGVALSQLISSPLRRLFALATRDLLHCCEIIYLVSPSSSSFFLFIDQLDFFSLFPLFNQRKCSQINQRQSCLEIYDNKEKTQSIERFKKFTGFRHKAEPESAWLASQSEL
jgi:hypothetical protein